MLEFISMTLTNFGPYKGSQRIDFPKRNGVVIFWGDNGRGKTTLLNAFRFALFGTIQRRNNALNTLKSMENHEARESGGYGFSIVLSMRGDDDEYLLTREFKPRSGVDNPVHEEDYAKKYFLKKNGSMLSDEDAAHELSMLLPEHVSRFFLFDGELLQEYEELLIDDTATGERIKGAIERILGVPVLTNSRQDIDAIRSTLMKQKSRAVKNDDQAQQFSNTLDGIEAGIEEHKQRITDLDQELKEHYARQVQIEERMKSTEQLREWQYELDGLRKDLARNQATHAAYLLEMRAAMKDAWRGMLRSRIEECLSDLREKAKILEVKHSQKIIADQVLSSIRQAVNDHYCPVCNQPVQGSAWTILDQRLRDGYTQAGLTDIEQRELIEATAKIRKLSGMLQDSVRSRVRGIEQQLNSLSISIDSDNAKAKEVQQRLAQYSGDNAESVRDLPLEYSKVLQKISNSNEAKRAETSLLDQKIANREKIMGQISKLESGADLREATLRLDLCDQIFHLFEEGVGKYRDALREKVERDATRLFVSISGDPDYTSLRINSNYGLNIVHKTGALVPGRSSGYEHIVALSLIGALHKNSPLGGPIIMDSPFGRLDKIHKKNIAATLPSMAEQVILLTYNGEIDRGVAIDNLSTSLLREYSLERISSMHTQIKQGV